MGKDYPDLSTNPFLFEFTNKAAKHNSKILEQKRWDLEEALRVAAPGTHLQYGSEFRPVSDLEPLLEENELWPKTKAMLQHGVKIPIDNLPEEVAKEDLSKGLVRGDHKGATKQTKLLKQLITKDIEHAFALPITQKCAENIKGGSFASLNIQSQWTINEKGERVKKTRLTHDQSFKGLESGISLNEQVIREELEPLIYGFMFLRKRHMIHAMRLQFPHITILLYKIDLDAAFRRMHLNATSAVKCICTTAICAAIYLRLTFGGRLQPRRMVCNDRNHHRSSHRHHQQPAMVTNNTIRTDPKVRRHPTAHLPSAGATIQPSPPL